MIFVLFSTIVLVKSDFLLKKLLTDGLWLMITTFQIKDDTKRAVYCSLIKLLQDNDLAVKVVSSYLIFVAFISLALRSHSLSFFCILAASEIVCLLMQLAASRSLCLHVEDANFSEQSFVDLLPVCWESCFKMVEEVQEFDSKVHDVAASNSL